MPRKSTVRKLIKSAKVGGILILCSIIIAIPVTMLTLPHSMKMAESVYRKVSMLLNANSPAQITLDDNGIPVVDFGYGGRTYVGKQRNPLAVASAAIQHYEEFETTGDPKHKTYFENCINWLEDTKIDKGKFYLWAYDYPDSSYGSPAPWYSALAQGRITLAFGYAYQVAGEERYLELAGKAMMSLDTPIEEGGVMYQGPESEGKWFVEVASSERDEPPFILNGHMEVMLYLHDFYDLTGVQQAQTLFQQGMAELKPRLHEYDTGRWTYYDREGNLAYDYHYTHIEELKDLYELTSDGVIKEYRDKWASYFPINPLWARKRFAAYLLNVAICFVALATVGAALYTGKRFIHQRDRKGSDQKLLEDELTPR